ncbi:MAG: proline--tRNA ligase [Candidatus Aenigmatarchaeota archaeon]
MSKELGIKAKKENLSEWYEEVILKTQLADYSPVKGCIIYLPYSYAIWNLIKEEFTKIIKDEVNEVYFPLFIPKSILEKEAKHFEGFSPEVAWVTKGGNSDLEEWLAIRPTSETIIYSYISKLIKSYRDLPLRIIQWCNVVRWETKATKPFLRGREFLWHEGHTFHATFEEAEEEMKKRIYQYKDFVEKYLAIPVIVGYKSEYEKFAGAHTTTTIETLLPDFKALQCGTSHNLADNFSKVFEIYFQDKDGKNKLVFQTSWGFSTRLIGALVMIHGDDKGLILPPKIAPYQIVIVPIYYNEEEKNLIFQKVKEIENKLKQKYRVISDLREEYTPGYKFNEWEMKGVPIRIEIGMNELKNKTLVIHRRDEMKKEIIKEEELESKINTLIEEIQSNLFNRAKKFLDEHIYVANNFEEFKEKIDKGFVIANHCGDQGCEEKIKELTKATCRVIEFDNDKPFGDEKCVLCGKKAKYKAYFARAY